MAKSIIFSPGIFKKYAKEELKELFRDCHFGELFEGNFILEDNYSKDQILKVLKENEPIFVHNALPIDLLYYKIPDYNSLAEEILKNNLLDKKKPFSIETITYGTPIKSRDIEVKIGSLLEEKGFRVDRKNFDQLIGVVIYKEEFYLGSSDVSSLLYPFINLSKRFSRETLKEGRLNRAQFKLVEALERFNIELNGEKKYALDLGASPGGWSKVLASKGYRVISIDGGDLDESLKSNPKIFQIKRTINDETMPEIIKILEERLNGEKFDIITNDMNLDFEKSKHLIDQFYNYLIKNGKVIMTLKSVNKNIIPALEKAQESLALNYKLVKAKHLDQNRQEITLYLNKNE